MKLQDRITQVLNEASYDGSTVAQNMEYIDDKVMRQSTGSAPPKNMSAYTNAVYNFVAQELSVGVNILKGFVDEHNIDVERVAMQLRTDKRRVEYMKRAVQDGSQKDTIRMLQAYPGPNRRRDRRKRRKG